MTNQEWQTLYSAGKLSQALDEMYRSYGQLEGWILKNSGNREDAKDIFQEALVILIKRARDRQFDPGTTMEAYLFGTCRYLWFSHLRKQSKWRQTEQEVDQSTIQEDVEDHREKESHFKALDRAMSALNEKCRELLTLFYFKKASMQNIAAHLGLKGANAAKTRKYKCLEAAKKLALKASHPSQNQLS